MKADINYFKSFEEFLTSHLSLKFYPLSYLHLFYNNRLYNKNLLFFDIEAIKEILFIKTTNDSFLNMQLAITFVGKMKKEEKKSIFSYKKMIEGEICA